MAVGTIQLYVGHGTGWLIYCTEDKNAPPPVSGSALLTSHASTHSSIHPAISLESMTGPQQHPSNSLRPSCWDSSSLSPTQRSPPGAFYPLSPQQPVFHVLSSSDHVYMQVSHRWGHARPIKKQQHLLGPSNQISG